MTEAWTGTQQRVGGLLEREDLWGPYKTQNGNKEVCHRCFGEELVMILAGILNWGNRERRGNLQADCWFSGKHGLFNAR